LTNFAAHLLLTSGTGTVIRTCVLASGYKTAEPDATAGIHNRIVGRVASM